MKDEISKGDLVCVNFNNSQYTLCSKAIVRYLPCTAGDSWVFKDISNDQLHYVSEGCTITLLEKNYES